MGFVTLDLREARAAESKRQVRAARKAAKLPKGDVLAKTKQAMGPNLFSLASGDPEDAKFRRISQNGWLRDLNPLMQQRMQQVCYYLAATTPFGKRIVEILTTYAVGEGFTVTCEDPNVQAVVDKYWDDSVNNLDENTKQVSNELAIFGELCEPVAVNPVDGFVRQGYVDPQEVDWVEFGAIQTGPAAEQVAPNTSGVADATFEMVTIPVKVHLKKRATEPQARVLNVIRLDEDPESPTWGQLTGDCFFTAINRAKGGSRGISELFSLADWIDVFDNMVFDFADKVRFLNAWVYHYVVKGADEKALDEFRRKVTKSPPRQGGIQVTNENVEINPITPDFKGSDMSESARMVKLYGMGGAGLPAWFFADPIDANRSTAQEMQGPTGKKLTEWQNNVKRNLRMKIDFVIAQAIAKGTIRQGANTKYTLNVPDLSVTDYGTAATAMQNATNALAIMEDRQWITTVTAARAAHIMLTQIGVEIDDTVAEVEKAKQEKQDRAANDANNLDPQANLAKALAQQKLLEDAAAAGGVQ